MTLKHKENQDKREKIAQKYEILRQILKELKNKYRVEFTNVKRQYKEQLSQNFKKFMEIHIKKKLHRF